jgi:hypothetical protein
MNTDTKFIFKNRIAYKLLTDPLYICMQYYNLVTNTLTFRKPVNLRLWCKF